MLERAKELALKALAVAILLGFFAGWILVFGALNELHGLRAVRSWPAVRGVITHSYARQERGFQNRRFWDVEIAGVYAGTGQRFGVARIGYGFAWSPPTRRRAEQLAARYPVGTELDVYHEPGNPRRAVLVRGNTATPTWITLGVGLGLGLLPLALYGFGRWRRARPARGSLPL